MVVEILLGLAMLVLILGLAGLSIFVAFFLPDMLKSIGYPVKVPGWGMRLQSLPPMNATVDDVSKGLELFLDRAVSVKGYKRSALKKKLNAMQVQWLRPQNDDGSRFIIDQWGRKIAGDHAGNLIRVVVLDDDTLNTTAFFHELGHEAHELEGKVDYDHKDRAMWDDIVNWCNDNFKA